MYGNTIIRTSERTTSPEAWKNKHKRIKVSFIDRVVELFGRVRVSRTSKHILKSGLVISVYGFFKQVSNKNFKMEIYERTVASK